MIQPGFAAIGPGGTYSNAVSYGNNGPNTFGNGSPQHDDGNMPNTQQQQQQQNGALQQLDGNGQQQAGGPPMQPEYTLAGILHFLQSEWRRYERDRNEWEIERAEMRARVALLEGERRSVENLKTDLMRRVKMLEFALRQERSKYLASNNAQGTTQPSSTVGTGNVGAINPKHAALQHLEKASTSSGRSSPAQEPIGGGGDHSIGTQRVAGGHAFNTLNTNTLNGMTMGGTGGWNTIGSNLSGGPGASLNRQGSSAKDPKARAKSREYLKQCLQEISYLTSASTLNPLPERAPSSSLLPGSVGHSRPRKTMPENVPSTYTSGAAGGGETQGTLTGARRQQDSKAVSTTGKTGLSRGVQPFNEPLVERDEESQSEADEQQTSAQSDVEGSESSILAENPNPVEGLALDKDSMTVEQIDDNAHESNSSSDGSALSSSDDSSRASSLNDVPLASDEGKEVARDVEHEPVTAIYRPDGTDDWAKLKEAGRVEREKRERERLAFAGETPFGDSNAGTASQAELQATSERVQQLMRSTMGARKTATTDEEDLANLTLPGGEVDEEASRIAAEAAMESQMWKSKRVLRGHLDSVRAVAFDTSDLGLYSASDDGTIKYWKLDAAGMKQNNRSSSSVSSTLSGSEADPLATLRGHSGAVTCLALSSARRRLYSGSVDTSVVVWKLLDGNTTEPYPPYDKTSEVARLVGHTQPVWDLCILPTNGDDEGLLASVSADGTVKIWTIQQDDGGEGRLLISFDYFGLEPSGPEKERERQALLDHGKGTLPVPTSVVPCMSDLRRCAVSYSNAVVKLFDVQTGKEVMQFASDAHYDGTPATQVNKVITHPTLPILVTGHENNYIQFFDINSGACTLSMVAHLDSVTSLDIDPSGLTLVSGGHDCSVRFWDIIGSTSSAESRREASGGGGGGGGDTDGDTGAARSTSTSANGTSEGSAAVCVQEITAHRKKSTEGVLVVKYHHNAPWFCSAGADGVIRIYG